jgi:SAM-dependent methyltransferase
MPPSPVTTSTAVIESSHSSSSLAARPAAFGSAPQGTQYSMRMWWRASVGMPLSSRRSGTEPSGPTLRIRARTSSRAVASGRVDEDGYFDEDVATGYDEAAAEMFDPAVVDPAVDFLAELAGGGRALELGIGTGRLALPLARRGVPVHGIDLSRAMVARLREKPGGEDIGVTIGDFATTSAGGTFSVAYLVFNTIMNLTTQRAQVACFRNVAAQLEAGGCFVIEVGVPELRRLPPGETLRAFHVSETRWGLDEYDVAAQGLTSHHFEIVDGRLRRLSIPFRYVWPSELDLMAQLASLSLRERWSGWKREPFTSESDKHISVWERSAATHTGR